MCTVGTFIVNVLILDKHYLIFHQLKKYGNFFIVNTK